MQYSAILREIDAELEKLIRVRDILAGTVSSVPKVQRTRSKKRSATGAAAKPHSDVKHSNSAPSNISLSPTPANIHVIPSIPEPVVTVLPPKQKREYRRTIKAAVPAPRALAAPRSSVVVVRPAPETEKKTAAIVPAAPPASPENLEALMRQKLFGSAVGHL